MVESLNTKVDFVIDATSFSGLTDYGKIMIGDKGFEFYHGRDPRKFIQIPWEEVDYVVASVFFKGCFSSNFPNSPFIFSSKKPKKVLREIRHYVDSDRMVHSLSFFQVVSRGIKGFSFKKLKRSPKIK